MTIELNVKSSLARRDSWSLTLHSFVFVMFSFCFCFFYHVISRSFRFGRHCCSAYTLGGEAMEQHLAVGRKLVGCCQHMLITKKYESDIFSFFVFFSLFSYRKRDDDEFVTSLHFLFIV